MARVVLLGELVCRTEEQSAIVRTQLPRHIQLTRAEPGCERFDVVATGDPLVWRVDEAFRNSEAFAEHQARIASSDWGRATTGIERRYVIVRPPRPDEAEALTDLHLRTWEEAYRDQFPASAWGDGTREWRLRMWTQLCSEPREDQRIAVAERDGVLVGFAGTGPSQDDPPPRERQLWFVYVLASEYGSGVGQALLDEVLGEEAASLWVLEANPRAIAFYARNRFVPDGAWRPTGFDTGGDEIRMVR